MPCNWSGHRRDGRSQSWIWSNSLGAIARSPPTGALGKDAHLPPPGFLETDGGWLDGLDMQLGCFPAAILRPVGVSFDQERGHGEGDLQFGGCRIAINCSGGRSVGKVTAGLNSQGGHMSGSLQGGDATAKLKQEMDRLGMELALMTMADQTDQARPL